METNLQAFEKKEHSPYGLMSIGLWFLVASVDLWVLYSVVKGLGVGFSGLLGALLFYFPMLIGPIFHLAGTILGIWGLVKARRMRHKKTLCVLGIFLNTLVALFLWAATVFLYTPTGVH